jgi:DNA-binding transcriptional ArsR family regulator
MKLVMIIGDEGVAKLLSNPMRRTILNILRERAVTEAGLAKRLELTDATVNYHLRSLKRARLVTVAKRNTSDYGIVQKFYLPSAYLYLPDVENLEPEAARYYLPINIERVRGALGAKGGLSTMPLSGTEVDNLAEEFASVLVDIARRYEGQEVEPGTGEEFVSKIYAQAFEALRKRRTGL